MGTKKESETELIERIGRKTGGLSVYPFTSSVKDSPDPVAFLMVPPPPSPPLASPPHTRVMHPRALESRCNHQVSSLTWYVSILCPTGSPSDLDVYYQPFPFLTSCLRRSETPH